MVKKNNYKQAILPHNTLPMKILAIDYGLKRTGLALSDALKISANGLPTIESKTLIATLTKIISEQTVSVIVLGLPKKLDNTPTDMTEPVLTLSEQLKTLFPNQELILWDERLTSVLAKSTILEAGISKKKRKDKGLVDKVAAVLLLQSYLQSL